MKEIVIYGIAALTSLFMAGYSVHMLVGGLVSNGTETKLIAAVIVIGILVLIAMARDLIRRRK